MTLSNNKALIYVVTFLAAISFGLDYGVSNQNTYLIHGLALANPSFLSNDWFARETIHYHDAFGYIIFFLIKLGLPLATSLVVIDLLLRFVSIYVIYRIVNLIGGEYSRNVFFVVLTLMIFEGTASVGGSYIFSSILQPSSFGAAFFILGVYLFLRGEYFYSGLCISLSGLIHTNFLLLSFVVFGIAHLFLGMENIIRRMFLQFFISGVFFLLRLGFLLDMASYEYSDTSFHIFQFIRSPHHYNTKQFLGDFFEFYGWAIVGFVGLIMSDMDVKLRKKLLGIYVGLLLPIVIAMVLTTVVYVSSVSQLFFWRMAPFCVLLSQIIFISYLFKGAKKEVVGHKFSRMTFLLTSLGFVLILKFYVYQYGILSVKFIFMSALIFFFLALLFKDEFERNFRVKTIQMGKAVSLGMLVVLIGIGVSNSIADSTFLRGYPNVWEKKLFDWAKNNTDNASVFLIPPDLSSFRLHAERAVVVDWKSTPIDPKGLVEWYKRIQDISGVENVLSLNDAMKGYSDIDLERIKKLKHDYHVNYVILKRGMKDLGLSVVYKNGEFVVLDVRGV